VGHLIYDDLGDAFHLTAPSRDGIGPRLAMQRALQHAKLSIHDVDYVNAHATSTLLGTDHSSSFIMRNIPTRHT
jgi:3-oxoacyl-(acyl-carrier-protein) synthase